MLLLTTPAATIASSIGAWAQSQREGWLAELYGEDITEDVRQLKPESAQSQLVSVLEDLLSRTCTVTQAVERTQQLVLSEPGKLFANLTGIYFSAVKFFADEGTTRVLVDYIVALAKLPDAVNEGPEPMVIDLGGDRTYSIQPGEVIDPGDGKLWRTLPGFSMYISEESQGTSLISLETFISLYADSLRAGAEAYLCHLSRLATPAEARDRWRNFNAWLVEAAASQEAQGIPVLAGLKRLGPRALAMALEHSPGTRLGRNTGMHLPAATLWMRKAEDEVKAVCVAGTQRFMAGDLWYSVCSEDDPTLCTKARLEFWRSRLVELGC